MIWKKYFYAHRDDALLLRQLADSDGQALRKLACSTKLQCSRNILLFLPWGSPWDFLWTSKEKKG